MEKSRSSRLKVVSWNLDADFSDDFIKVVGVYHFFFVVISN